MTEVEILEERQKSEEIQSPLKAVRNLAILGIIGAILLAFFMQFVVTPWITARNEVSTLNNIAITNGPITPLNITLVTFQGQKIANANTSQKALAVGSVVATPAGFIFSNGKEGNRHVVDVFLDFSSQHSRDFLLMNRNNLEALITNGLIELRLHPVPTGNALSMYSAEAIAEAFVTTPDKAWDFNLELTRLAATVDTNKAEDIVALIEETAKEINVTGIDAASIQNGTFSSWIISVGDDTRLQKAFTPPLIYIDGKILDVSTVNVNNPDDFRKAVLK
jgi:hypothetical protein